MKKPEYTTEQQAAIEAAEALQTRATILELGVAEFLKNHHPCDSEVAEASKVLQLAVTHRSTHSIFWKDLRDGEYGTTPLDPARSGKRKKEKKP